MEEHTPFEFDSVKAEKAYAIRRYNRLRTLKNAARILEVCALLILFGWSSTRFRTVLSLAVVCSQQLAAAFRSPLFVFLLSNVILLVVLTMSYFFSDESSNSCQKSAAAAEDEDPSSTTTTSVDFQKSAINFGAVDQEVFGKDQLVLPISTAASREIDQNLAAEENNEVLNVEDVNQVLNTEADDQIVNVEETTHQIVKMENAENNNAARFPPPTDAVSMAVAEEAPAPKKANQCRRSQSETFQRDIYEAPAPRELRRSETCRRETESVASTVDELSNEEFKQTVEEFINRERAFMMKESMGVVSSFTHSDDQSLIGDTAFNDWGNSFILFKKKKKKKRQGKKIRVNNRKLSRGLGLARLFRF